jgi:hypothetical protein
MSQDLENRFDQFMDLVYPVVQIGYLNFYPSQILKQLDPIAYNQALLDFEDEENK